MISTARHLLARWVLGVLVVVMTVGTAGDAAAIGRVIYSQGQAQLVRNLKDLPAPPGFGLEENDTLRVQIGAKTKAILSDDTILMIWEDTEIRLDKIKINLIAGLRELEIEQITGNLRLISADFLGQTSTIIVRTPNAIITVEGESDFIVRQGVQGDNTEIIVFTGNPKVQHLFSDFGGEVILEPQQTSIISTDRAPSTPVFVDRASFDQLLSEQMWTLPQPVPDWEFFLEERLEEYATRSFGRVRRMAAKPFTPVRTISEAIADQNVPDRPGDLRPEPTSRLEVRIECSSCAANQLGGN